MIPAACLAIVTTPAATPLRATRADPPCPAEPSQDLPLCWSVNLARSQPAKIVGVAAAFALILVWSLAVFHTLVLGLVGVAVAASAVKEYLAPLHYRLDCDGASVRCAGVTWISMPWREIRSVYRVPCGLKLSPHADPVGARFESIRGLTLRAIPPEISADVVDFAQKRRAAAAEAAQ